MDSIQFSNEDLDRLKDWLRKQPHLPQNISGKRNPLLDVCCFVSLLRNTNTTEMLQTLPARYDWLYEAAAKLFGL